MTTTLPQAAKVNQIAWERDAQINAHYLVTSGGYYVVCKSEGGDYYAGFTQEGAPACDGDIEYFPSVAKAKAWCEKQAENAASADAGTGTVTNTARAAGEGAA